MQFNLIQNYIYLYHLDKVILLPTYPESVSDNLSANFSSTSPLARSAPIFSYSNSGPRSMQIRLSLHRDMMWELNSSNYKLQQSDTKNTDLIDIDHTSRLMSVGDLEMFGGDITDDYTDVMIKLLQTIAVPVYQTHEKLVNPPMIALRLGNDLFIKGIVNGGISVDYKSPILDNGKYAVVDVSFTVSEVDPYDATTIAEQGSFRGLNTTLERQIYKR